MGAGPSSRTYWYARLLAGHSWVSQCSQWEHNIMLCKSFKVQGYTRSRATCGCSCRSLQVAQLWRQSMAAGNKPAANAQRRTCAGEPSGQGGPMPSSPVRFGSRVSACSR